MATVADLPMAALEALLALAGDDAEVLRRTALMVNLAKAKGGARVEVFGAVFFFNRNDKSSETQPQPHTPEPTPPSAASTLDELLSRPLRARGSVLGRAG